MQGCPAPARDPSAAPRRGRRCGCRLDPQGGHLHRGPSVVGDHGLPHALPGQRRTGRDRGERRCRRRVGQRTRSPRDPTGRGTALGRRVRGVLELSRPVTSQFSPWSRAHSAGASTGPVPGGAARVTAPIPAPAPPSQHHEHRQDRAHPAPTPASPRGPRRRSDLDGGLDRAHRRTPGSGVAPSRPPVAPSAVVPGATAPAGPASPAPCAVVLLRRGGMIRRRGGAFRSLRRATTENAERSLRVDDRATARRTGPACRSVVCSGRLRA